MRANTIALGLLLLIAPAAMAADAPAVNSEQRTADGRAADPGEVNSGQRIADSEEAPPANDRGPQSAGPAVATTPVARGASDRLELDTTVVTGNRELPKVLYIVPWKKANLGDLPGQPFNTLLDEVLEPVDRDVFRREVTYFDAVTGGASATQSTSADPR